MRIHLSPPHMSGTERAHIDAAFAANFIAPAGPQLDAFEAAVADYLGEAVCCVGLASGTAALHLALILAGVGRGDEVWVASMTFAGGVFPILYLGATPVFFDLDAGSWTTSADLLEEALAQAARSNRLPRAIVPTELYGQGCDILRLEALANHWGVALIPDSAESLGALYPGGRKAGTGGMAAVLSFNGNKIITTSGGGMLVTRDAAVAARARFLATQAREPAPHYQHQSIGYNYRLSNVSAAIGLGQIGVIEDRVAARRAVFARYGAGLARDGIDFMPEPAGHRSSRWLSAVTIDPARCGLTREDLRLSLLAAGIESRPLWKPMHLQPVFSGARYVGMNLDAGLFDRGLCLPSGSALSVSEQDEVIGRILEALPGRKAAE